MSLVVDGRPIFLGNSLKELDWDLDQFIWEKLSILLGIYYKVMSLAIES